MKNKKLFAILTLLCFMFTLMPVAAFAADDTAEISLKAVQNSYIYAEDAEVDVDDEVELNIKADASITSVTVWFEAKTNVPTTALEAVTTGYKVDKNGLMNVVLKDGKATVEVSFDDAGKYELHASAKAPAVTSDAATDTWAEAIAAIADYELQTESGYDVVTVNADSADSNDYVITGDGLKNTKGEAVIEDGDTVEIEAADANGIEEKTVTFNVFKNFKKQTADATEKTLGEEVYAYNVEFDTTANVSVNDVKAKRDGSVTFDVVAEKAGTHKVYVTIDNFKVTFKVNANEGEAEDIELVYVSQTPVNLDVINHGLGDYMIFEIYDANGNELTDTTSGFDRAVNSGTGADDYDSKYDGYVAVVEQPAKSDIENENLYLVRATNNNGDGWTIAGANFEEEGEYTFKVALNDGTSAKATITVKEAGDPVALSISYHTTSVQLGAEIAPKSIGWLDANNVFTSALNRGALSDDVVFTASGAAVKAVDENGVITVKDDEKYVGSKIEVAVVDEENNLVATKTLTVAAEAKELAFDTTSVPVDTTRTIGVKLVDEDGNTVSLDATTASAYVVVLAKPADCDVTAEVKDGNAAVTAKKGTFDINFSADTVGAVTIQAVLKAEANNVVRYYTGTQVITVGANGIEDIVVLSINSNEIVINGDVKEIDAAPIVENNRTFVPFRALAEAFGATVAYDEATQAVTAELNGVTVVMTIGSAEYTVNGEPKTADVAPFINGSRTMVPVRFAAEAFGITVTPTYDDNGATADVVFTK